MFDSRVKRLVFLASILLSSSAHAGEFLNLDFENARTNSVVQSEEFLFDHYGSASDLLPGWEVFYGDQQFTNIGFNLSGFGSSRPSVSLLSSEPPYTIGQLPDPIEGKYSLSLGVWFDGNALNQYSIVQRGDIPADAQYLTFTLRRLPFAVSINGFTISEEINGGDPPSGRTVFADISQFAGQNVELKFTTSSGPFGPTGFHELDNIMFVVPEPSVGVLLGIGIAVSLLSCTALRECSSRVTHTKVD